ncbi:MAG: AAA family ATPase [Myxococcota bacterium]
MRALACLGLMKRLLTTFSVLFTLVGVAATGGQVQAAEPATPDSQPAAVEAHKDPGTETSEIERSQIAALHERAQHVRALIAGTLGPEVDARALFVVPLDGLGTGEDLRALLRSPDPGSGPESAEPTVPDGEDPPASDADPGATDPGSDPETAADPGSEPAPKDDGAPQVPSEEETDPGTDSPEGAETPESSDDTPTPPESVPDRGPGSLAEARAELRTAYRAFLVLPASERRRLLAAHDAQVLDAARESDIDTTVAELSQRAALLGAYVEGTLGPEQSVGPLLDVDLLGARQAAEDGRTRDAEAALQQAREAYLNLSAEGREALRRAHADAVASAEATSFVDDEAAEAAEAISDAQAEAADAAREREAALEVAREARSEALRVVAEERARLLGVKEQQALFAASIPEWTQQARALHESALEWHRRIDELETATMSAESLDTFYPGVGETLDALRTSLSEALARAAQPGRTVPRPSRGFEDAELPADVDRGDLPRLRDALEREAAALTRSEEQAAWDVATLLRDDLVLLNHDRLRLLPGMSDDQRADLTGFGASGRAQARREAEQIGLELRYHAMSLPRDVASVFDAVQRRPLDFVIRALQLIVLIAIFRWWRANGEALLKAWRTPSRGFERTQVDRIRSRVFWYVQRIRRPVEWLVILAVLPLVVGTASDMPELRLPWLALVWTLGGRAVVRTIDAIAERQSLYVFGGRDHAKLRFRSLRLIGVLVTGVGLILTLTSDIVGRGTIYRWVLQACWILVAPVFAWLVSKWRPIIFERLEALSRPNAVVRWAKENQGGVVGFLAAAVGGGYLLAQGTSSWVLRQLSGLDTTRKVLAYLFRREVAKQAETATVGARGEPLAGAAFDKLGPQSAGSSAPVLEGPARTLVEQVLGLAEGRASTLSVVVGERGAGKTTFLRRVIAQSDDTTCIVGCPPEGFEALLEALAVQFNAADYQPDSVARAIRDAGPSIICIDDAHRMIAPAVGGLEELDRFTQFALEVGGDVSWIVAVQHAAWHFVGRARADRVFFDQVIELPRWSEEDIASLIQSRTRAVGLSPNFDELVVAGDADERPLEERRTELGYYRILWDHSAGNPAVALQAWRHSLFVRAEEEKPVVRLFVEPSSAEIERLPGTLLFVLRAVVQLELATAAQVAECTQLPVADVADAIRFSVARGYVEPKAGRFRLSWAWYRTITTVLTRQHLLVA